MTERNFISEPLKNAIFGLVFSLTFIATFVDPTHARADTATDSIVAKERMHDVQQYIKQQTDFGLAILPSGMRDTISWMANGWQPVSLSTNDEVVNDPTTQADAIQQDGSWQSVQFASNYHHKGFLPFHDALMLGAGVNHAILDNKMLLAARPFFGKSWNSLRHYWGQEIALDIDHRADDLPWGRIVLTYTGGDGKLTDHGTGLNLHGDVDLTEGWKFTSGVYKDNNSSTSNYVMLRWKVSLRNP